MRNDYEGSRRKGLDAAHAKNTGSSRAKEAESSLTAHHSPAPTHAPFAPKDRQTVLECVTHGRANLDRAFRRAATLTGRYPYECRMEYLKAMGVSWTGHPQVVRPNTATPEVTVSHHDPSTEDRYG